MFVAEGTNIGRVKSQQTGPEFRKNESWSIMLEVLYASRQKNIIVCLAIV